jgi:hypothetical protein
MALEGPRDLGKLQLHTFTTGHGVRDWAVNKENLTSAIELFPLIIPEYFPPEYQNLTDSDNPLIDHAMEFYSNRNYLFVEVAKQCAELKKDVWVVDPAYDLNFGFLRQGLVSASYGAALSLAYGGLNGLRLSAGRPVRDISRRGLLFGSLTSVIGGTLLTASGHVPKPISDLEDDLRETVTAEFITRIPEYLNEPTEGLLIHTPGHWRKIKYLLDNPEVCKEKLERYRALEAIPPFQTLFRARHYPEGSFDRDKLQFHTL